MLTLRDGRTLSYAEFGDPLGAPVIFCYGIPGSHQDGAPADIAARSLGVRLIVPDRPGYGLSDPVRDPTPRAFAQDVVELVASLALPRCSILGFSGGGLYAITCAAALGPHVRRLALAGSYAPFEPDLLQGVSDGVRELFTLAAGDWGVFTAALSPIASDGRALSEAVIAGLPAVDKAIFDDPVLRSAYEASCAIALHQGADAMLKDWALLTRPWDFDPRALKSPTTLWHGVEDQNAPPEMSERLAAMMPHARLSLVAGAGHCFLWRRWSDVLASAIEV